jgi:hypothetical protein
MHDHRQLIAARLRNERLDRPARITVDKLVTWMGAVQSQDYAGASWGVGQRIHGATAAVVDRALDSGAIVRTHAMRPTWHFVAAADLIWLQRLTGPRVQQLNHTYYRRNELDAALLTRAAALMERLLRDQRYLTRNELADALKRDGIVASHERLALLVMHAELEAIVCSGPRRGKQFTYALVGERMPSAATLTRDEALETLVRRYFSSHGPATIRDFSWWSGLTMADAKRGVAAAGRALQFETIGELTYWSAPGPSAPALRSPWARLLPNYDEMLVAYRDRDPLQRFGPAARDRYQHHLMIDGRIAGSWRGVAGAEITVVTQTYRPLTASETRAVDRAIAHYTQFVG